MPHADREPEGGPYRAGWYFFALLLFLAAANMWWVFVGGGGPQHWDSAIHLSESLGANRVFDGDGGLSLRSLLNVSWYYPPLVSYAAVPFYRLFGESESTGYIVETFFLLVLVACVSLIGKRLWGTRTGFLAALLVSSFPIVIEYSRVFMLDLPVAAMAALCTLCLIESEGFQRPWWGLAAGGSLGLGELTKWTFVAFVIAPLLFSCIEAFRGKSRRGKGILTMVLSMLLAIAVCGPWYAVHIVQILTSRGGELSRGDYTLFQSVFLYLHEISGEVSWWGAALMAIGVIGFFRLEKEKRLYLGAWFLSAYALISIAGIKAPRLAIPLLIPASLMSARGAEAIFGRFKTRVSSLKNIAWGVLAVVLLQLLLVLFVPSLSRLGRLLSTEVLGVPILSVEGADGRNWDNTPALAAIMSDMHTSGRSSAVVRVIPDFPYFNNSTVSYYAQVHRYPLRITGTSGFPMFTDYILLKSGEIGIDSPDRHRAGLTGQILLAARSGSTAYHLIGSLSLPDGSSAFVVSVLPIQVPLEDTGRVIAGVRTAAGSMIRRYFRPVSGYQIDVQGYDGVETARGHIAAIRIRMDSAAFGDFAFNERGIAVSGLDIEIRDVLIDPGRLLSDTTLQIFAIRGLSVNGFCIRASDIASYLSKGQSRDLQITGVSMNQGVLSLSARVVRYDMPIELGVRLSPAGRRNLRFAFTHARIGRLPLPASLLNLLTDSYNPIVRGLDVLGDVEFAPLKLEGDRLTIGGAAH